MKRMLGISVILFGVISLFIGVKGISFQQLLAGNSQQRLVFLTTRIPRTASLILAGSTISICGLVMQQLLQNKFISPTTAGTMDSARVGILIVMLFFPNASLLFRSAVAFLFAFCGTLIFLLLARIIGYKEQITLPLVGIMFGNIIGSAATFFAYQFQLVQNMSSWLQGNFSTVSKGSYELIYLTLPIFLFVYLFAYQMTIAGLGEDFAKNLGLSYRNLQTLGILLIAFASGVTLITVGSIPFLGVIVPNLVSMMLGDQVKNTLIPTALFGSLFLLICDIIARLVVAPYEVSVSLVVGILGSVFFGWLLIKKGRAG